MTIWRCCYDACRGDRGIQFGWRVLSVAICTFNRAESLRRTLESLAQAAPPATAGWELIVVDNNSSDHTREVAAAFSDSLPMRYVFEQEQGLSAARNRAMREFRGDVLLFTDDDVTVDPDWLVHYDRAIAEFPDAAYFGGRVLPLWPNGRPRWLHDESLALLSGLLVRFHLGEVTRPFQVEDPTPYGASFALRRSTITQVGNFNRALGVKAQVPGRGEESEYLSRALAASLQGVYVSDAIVHHWTDPARLGLRYLYRYGVQTGVALRVTGSTERGSVVTATMFALRGLLQLLKGRGDRARQCVINVGVQMALRALAK